MNIKNGDGLILFDGSRMIAEGEPWDRGNLMFDDWRIAAWTEDHELRLPIQVVAIVEVWRNGVRMDTVEQVEQLELF